MPLFCRSACSIAVYFAAISIFYLILPQRLDASEPDTLRVQLSDIYIEASRLPVAWNKQPVQVSLIDAQDIGRTDAQSLGDALRFNSPVTIRTYGLGGIQSVSGRGFGARQTQLMWNGFSINHAMLGETDYNLIPAGFASNLRVASGNSSAGFGDGGAAGSVLFDPPEPSGTTTLGYRQGRWAQQQFSLRSGYSGDRLHFGLHLSGAQATNDYPYFDEIRGREEVRRNNQFSNRHAMLTGGYRSGNFNLNSALWLGSARHNISGSSTIRNPSAVQDDDFIRWTNHAAWHHTSGLWQVSTFREAYRLNYTDSPARIESESDLSRTVFRLTHSIPVTSRFFLSTGTDAGFSRVETNNFDDTHTRQQYSFYLHSELNPVDPLLIYPSLRLVHYSDFGSRVTGALGFNVQTPISFLRFRGQAATNFSPPTLNDLYWSPGGNPDLAPEESVSLEAGLAVEQAFSRDGLFRFGITAYRIRFENGIRWTQGRGGVWTPRNLDEINSRGLESDASLRLRYSDWRFEGSLAVAYTKAESPRTEIRDGQEVTVHRQLTYVPKWSWKSGLEIGYGPVFAGLSWQRTGSRFSTADHSSPSDPLEAITDLTLQTGASFSFGGIGGQLTYTLHNVYDRQNEFIIRYPMPPRYHTLGIEISFNY